MTKYVALYCRLSPRPDGSYEGVDAQEKWGRDYAASAWPDLPVEVFADSGISAANGDHRPEYERLREWIAAGKVAHVWAVEQTRLERREVQWFQLAAELDAAGITELHTNRDGIVRVRDEVAGIKAVLAAGEVRKLKRRVNDRLAEIAANGEPPGSRPFGYVHGVTEAGARTYVIVPEQAAAIRDAAEKILSGWSLANIAADWRERGLHGPHQVKVRDEAGEVIGTRPGRLTANSVRKAVTMPTVAGHRVHKGRIIGRGNWEPILDEATWQACRAKLSAPRMVRRKDGHDYPVGEAHTGPAGRRYVLTGGLAVCDVCDHAVVGSVKQMRRGRGRVVVKPYLLCHPNRGGRGCVGIMEPETTAHVIDRLFAELDKPEFLDAVAADDHEGERERLTRALDDVERQRNELAEMWATPGELTAAEWRTARRALAENEQRLRRELAAAPPPTLAVDIAQARSAWPDMTLDEQREFVRLFIARVRIRRATPGTKGFDPGRVAIEWRRL